MLQGQSWQVCLISEVFLKDRNPTYIEVDHKHAASSLRKCFESISKDFQRALLRWKLFVGWLSLKEGNLLLLYILGAYLPIEN